jgi:hypothetical protein
MCWVASAATCSAARGGEGWPDGSGDRRRTGGGRADSGDAVGRDGRTEALTSGGLVALDRGLGLSGVGETDD